MDRPTKAIKASELEVNQVLHYCRTQLNRVGMTTKKEKRFGTITKIEPVAATYRRITLANNDKVIYYHSDEVWIEIGVITGYPEAPRPVAEKYRGVSIE